MVCEGEQAPVVFAMAELLRLEYLHGGLEALVGFESIADLEVGRAEIESVERPKAARVRKVSFGQEVLRTVDMVLIFEQSPSVDRGFGSGEKLVRRAGEQLKPCIREVEPLTIG